MASSISNLKNRQQAWKGNVIEAKVFSAEWPVAKKDRKKEFQWREEKRVSMESDG